MNSRPTLSDVARETGLSIAAVSKALNGYPHVSESTRQRVTAASERLGYHPRRRARPVTRRSEGRMRIGLLLLQAHADSYYVHRWVNAVTQAARQQGARLELGPIIDQESPGCDLELRRHAEGVEGLLLYGYAGPTVLRLVRQLRVPVVLVGDIPPTQPRPPHQVVLDAQGMAMHATQTLLAQGHRRIGFFCPPFPEGGWIDQWLCGYQLAMLRSDVGLDEALCPVLEPRSEYEIGHAAAAHMAALDPVPTAFVVPGTGSAAIFRQVMADYGHQIGPTQMIVGGDPDAADGCGLAGFPVVCESAEDGATHAMEMLLRLGRKELVPGRLIVPHRSRNFTVFSDNASSAVAAD